MPRRRRNWSSRGPSHETGSGAGRTNGRPYDPYDQNDPYDPYDQNDLMT